ncbi:MAG: hypothetical protein PWP76_708 [Candidatus Diapherotrites archaeon]|nr:hypothetical protein [Candidatus Diapherotrites archaeon]
MRRYLLVALALIMLSWSAFALTLNVKTVPGVVTPGTGGKMIFEITATSGAKNIYMRVGPSDQFSIEDEDTRIDVGDAMGGTVSYVLGFSVPSDIKPGVYVLPVTIEYDDPTTGTHYEEQFAPIITVTSGKGIDVKMSTDRVYGGREMSVKFTVSNSGEKIYNAVLTVPSALGDPNVYLGDIGSGEEKETYVTILPECNGGIYTIPLTISGYRGTEAFSETVNYSVKCVPPREDIRVTMNIPEKVSGGEQNTELVITNLTSVALGPISVSITGINVRLGGQTSHYINAIQPNGKVTIPVVWKLEKSDEVGSINVVLTTPTGTRTYSFSVLPEDEPEISVYLAEEPKWEGDHLKVTIAVANVGTGTAENVFVETNSPKAFAGKDSIGDLAPGDYDTATVYLSDPGEEEKIHVKVTYTAYGERKTEEDDIAVKVPKKPANYTALLLALFVIVGAVWWWRKRK